MLNQIRFAVISIVGILTGLGILPAGADAVLEENAEAIIGGILGVWATFLFFRNRKDSKNEVQ